MLPDRLYRFVGLSRTSVGVNPGSGPNLGSWWQPTLARLQVTCFGNPKRHHQEYDKLPPSPSIPPRTPARVFEVRTCRHSQACYLAHVVAAVTRWDYQLCQMNVCQVVLQSELTPTM
jgi:hypothetical protein